MGARREMSVAHGVHERIYRSLLKLYPADFRAGYADQMVQLFSDQLRDQGPGRSWLKAVGDIPGSAASERLRRNRTVAHSMTLAPTLSSRVLGALGILGGFVLLAAFAVDFSASNNDVRLILFNLGAIAVVLAVHRVQSSAGSRLALAGALPALFFNALNMFPIVRQVALPGEPLVPGFVWIVVAGFMWLSDLWFGLVTLRLGIVSRIGALALIIGSFFAFVGMDIVGVNENGTLLNAVIMTGLAVHGMGWILLGLDVALRRRAAPVAS